MSYRRFIIRDGSEKGFPAVATGSHIDEIPFSGKYDGVVGVLGALEAINVLRRSGFQPKRPLEVIMFTSEEPTRFGISCLGSRLLAGSEALVNTLKLAADAQNISFFDAAKSAGYNLSPDDLSKMVLAEGSYAAFVELHIEQGPLLEEEGLSIGIVTAIAAPASIKVEFEGNGGHAGAVLMPKRHWRMPLTAWKGYYARKQRVLCISSLELNCLRKQLRPLKRHPLHIGTEIHKCIFLEQLLNYL